MILLHCNDNYDRFTITDKSFLNSDKNNELNSERMGAEVTLIGMVTIFELIESVTIGESNPP